MIIASENVVLKYSIENNDEDYGDYVHDCKIMMNMKKDKTRRRQYMR